MRRILVLVVLVVAPLTSSCADDGAGAGEATVVRLGYFPNVTHAPAIVGVEEGILERALGRDTLEARTFNAGPAAVEALLAEAIDATYIGPNPAINAFAKSRGAAVRIVAGATSGGAALVVEPGITSAAQLRGKTIASPQLGNTQDVALRAWLAEQGLRTDTQGGGDVSIVPQENAQTLDALKAGQIDGAWVPEPWVTRLVEEGGGTVLVDEKTLWPGGRFVTTHLVVRTEFLEEHPDTVKCLLEGHAEAVERINANGADAQTVTNAGIEEVTGKKLGVSVIAGAWRNLTFTVDPIASSLRTSAENAEKVGLLDPVDLDGIYDLDLLNEVLRATGRAEVPT